MPFTCNYSGRRVTPPLDSIIYRFRTGRVRFLFQNSGETLPELGAHLREVTLQEDRTRVYGVQGFADRKGMEAVRNEAI